MQAKDNRKLEKTSAPGIYRRHSADCKGGKRCGCSYVVRWQAQGKPHKQMFPTWEQAREFKGTLDSGKSNCKPLSSKSVTDYYASWLPNFRGRTSRGLDEGTRREYEISFRLHILPTPIAQVRLRYLAAPDVRDWLKGLERKGASPITIRKAKAALAVMLACAVEDGDIATNPAHGVRYVPTERAKARHPKRKRHHLTAADLVAILDALESEWRPFFTLLAQSGTRVSELFGLTWGNVHLGDDPHILIAEQVYAGKRKKLKTDASRARVPLSLGTAAMLADLRPEDVEANTPVFASATGTPLNNHNVYSRVLRPALERSGLAVVVDRRKVVKRGKESSEPVYDYQGIGFHALRKAAGSLLLANGKTLKQVQGWLRHAQLTTTMNVYIHQVDDGLGTAEIWDDILGPTPADREPTRVQPGANGHPETAANGSSPEGQKPAAESQIPEQPQTAAS